MGIQRHNGNNGLAQFTVHFSRYKDGQSILSAPVRVSAADFTDAFEYADIYLGGLESADPVGMYYIHSVSAEWSSGPVAIAPATAADVLSSFLLVMLGLSFIPRSP